MIAPARLAALDALISIETGEVDLGEAISRAGQPLKDERDRGLLLELVTGTLRMRGALDYQLARLVTRALGRLDTAVLTVLRMGAYQLIYLSKIPSSAAVDDAVELTRRAGKTSASGLVNAVLRALSRERDRLNWPERPVSPQSSEWVTYLSVIHSHPVWLIERWIDRYGVDPAERWLKFNNRPPALCIAANRTLTSREQLGAELRGEGVQTRPTQRAPHGLHIVEGNPLASRAFREGRCVVQDEASQLIPELIDERAGARVLDLCASPGGKTVALAAKVGVTGLVVASDVRAHRLRVLRVLWRAAKSIERVSSAFHRKAPSPCARARSTRWSSTRHVRVLGLCGGIRTFAGGERPTICGDSPQRSWIFSVDAPISSVPAGRSSIAPARASPKRIRMSSRPFSPITANTGTPASIKRCRSATASKRSSARC